MDNQNDNSGDAASTLGCFLILLILGLFAIYEILKPFTE